MQWRQILKILFIVSIFYLPPSVYLVKGIVEKMNDGKVLKTVAELQYLNNLIKTKISEQQFVQICSTLELLAQKNQNQFQFDSNLIAFSIENKDVACNYRIEDIQPVDSLLTLNRYVDFSWKEGTRTYFKGQHENTTWVISLRTIPLLGFWDRLKTDSHFRSSLLTDLLLFLYTIAAYTFLTTYLIRKSILNIVRGHTDRLPKYPKLNKILNLVQDTQLVEYRKLFATFVQQNDRLRKMLDRNNMSLNSTILKMIQDENLVLPYYFQGTVVGVDVNGYSKVTAKYENSAEILTDKIIEIGMELVQRYGGLYAGSAGDEVVVVFDHVHLRTKNDLSLQMLGAAFARDVMRDYSKIVFQFQGEDRQFFLKAGLADSQLVFKETAAGQIFGGDGFTFSKRLSASVKTETINAMAVLSKDIHQIKDIVTLTAAEKIDFKNMGLHEVHQIQNFLSVKTVYETRPDLLSYFRSDVDICFLLNALSTEKNSDKINLILHSLADIHTQNIDDSVKIAWQNAIQDFQKKSAEIHFNKNFSRLIIVSKNLIPTKQWSQKQTDLILNIPRFIDGRINASIVELLVDKNLYEIVTRISETFLIANDTSFRAYAELLIAQATFNLSELVLSDILEMLKSDNPLRMSSGVYVAHQILNHYSQKNAAGLKTYAGYQKIITELHQIKLNRINQLSERMQKILMQF